MDGSRLRAHLVENCYPITMTHQYTAEIKGEESVWSRKGQKSISIQMRCLKSEGLSDGCDSDKLCDTLQRQKCEDVKTGKVGVY